MKEFFRALKELWFRERHADLVFKYKTLRLLIGIIAISLWIVVIYFSKEPELTSISVSYHTPARDAFVGWLFVVGAFLMAYEGHYFYEGISAKVASAMAFLVAISPTECTSIAPSLMCTVAPAVEIHSDLHQFAAACLFIILAFFCLGPFARRASSKPGLSAVIRKWIYRACGTAMLGAMAYIIYAAKTSYDHPRAVFYGEVVALTAFGIAWIVAGQQYLKLIPKSIRNS